MIEGIQAPLRLVLSMAAILAVPAASSAQIKLIMSGGFPPAAELLPEFEKTTGISVTVSRGESQGGGPNSIGSQIGRGVPLDVVIMSREGLDDLIAERKIVANSEANLSQSPLELVVRAGAPKPDITTVDALRQTLLHAKSITFPAHVSGNYMRDRVLSRLGIASQVSAKATIEGAGAVAKGEAEIGILPLSELVHSKGVDIVGAIPAEAQYISVFSTAVVQGSTQVEASKRLIAFLTSEKARATLKPSGMESPK